MNILSRKLDDVISKELTSVANQIADTAKRNASWSTDIPKAISVGEVERLGDGKYSISVKVDMSERTGAPQAHAFEFGSGIHSSTDPAKKYKIEPKDAPALAFEFALNWMPRKSKLKGVLGIGGFKNVRDELNKTGSIGKTLMFWNYVEHPGVEPRPYLRPAMDSVRKTFKNRFLSLFIKALREDDMFKAEFIK